MLNASKGVHDVEWLTDSAFGVHPDFKSHTGGTMLFKGGKGSPINISAKQKLNTESSTGRISGSGLHITVGVMGTAIPTGTRAQSEVKCSVTGQ